MEPRQRPKRKRPEGETKGKWKNHGVASQRRDKPPSPRSYRYTQGAEDDGTATPAVTPGADTEASPKKARRDSANGNPENRSPPNYGAKDEDENELKDDDDEDEEEEEEEEEQPKPSPVQILDLHTESPWVSYRGQTFSCEWASNIGTELLFTPHDDDSRLPVLRALPGGVDLLAASSCRLLSTSITLEPKFSARSRMTTALPSRANTAMSIPVGPAASQKRKDQARFLEGLMSIKRAKGEEDEVTVIAQKRQLNNKWKLIWKKSRQAERKKLTEFIRIKANASYAQEEVERAKQRLSEMDKEDGLVKSRGPAWGDGGEGMAKRSGRKKKGATGVSIADIPHTTMVPKHDGLVDSEAASYTPTPNTSARGWENPEAEDEEDEEDEDMEDMDDMAEQHVEDGEEDEGSYDDDDPGGGLYD